MISLPPNPKRRDQRNVSHRVLHFMGAFEGPEEIALKKIANSFFFFLMWC